MKRGRAGVPELEVSLSPPEMMPTYRETCASYTLADLKSAAMDRRPDTPGKITGTELREGTLRTEGHSTWARAALGSVACTGDGLMFLS